MKKKALFYATMLLCCFAAPAFSASAEDYLVLFSTQGPDKYSDGTPVLDGEHYAVVWTRNGKEFGGFNADATVQDPENDQLIVAMPLAKDGKCPMTNFQLAKETVAPLRESGTFSIYLLDTRRADGRGGMSIESNAFRRVNGFRAINASGDTTASGLRLPGSGGVGSALTSPLMSTASATTEVSAVPAGTPRPHIQAVKVENGVVRLTVKNTVPFLQYNASHGKTRAGQFERERAANPINGSADGTIEVVVPLEEGDESGFTRVIRN